MAERRMFTKKIVDSDAFLDMPLSAQCLYFHLNMRADDEGVCDNPKKIMRMIGASEGDMQMLIAKRFLLVIENNLIVIKHWWMHNYLRKDRFHQSQYHEELQALGLKENGAYTEVENLLIETSRCDGNQLATSGVQNGNQLATEVKDIVKDIDKDNINNTINFEHEFDQLWAIYPRKQGKKRAFEAYKRARKNGIEYEAIKKGINAYVRYIQKTKTPTQYIKQGSTFFAQAAWQDDWFGDVQDMRIQKAEEDHELDGIL